MSDVLIGPGRLYRSPVATSNPDESTVAFGTAWGGSWTDMGDFPEGSPIAISMPESVFKVYGQQSTGVKAVSRTRREPMVKGALQELSVANMAIVLDTTAATTAAAGGGQKGYSDLPIGNSSDVELYKWGIEAFRLDDNNVKQPVRWFFHKGWMRMSGDTVHSKTGETAVPFEITVIDDDTQSVGAELGLLQIVTAAATAT